MHVFKAVIQHKMWHKAYNEFCTSELLHHHESLHIQRESNYKYSHSRIICDSSVYHSAYEQKQPAGMKPSSPVTPPCSTPVSPLHHASPTAAPTPKPDRTYAQIPSSQPLPDNAYSMDHRYCSPQPFTFTSHLHVGLLAGGCTQNGLY